MQTNISGFGTSVQLVASNTFPQGVTLAQAADDADFMDFAELVVAESGMGLNGNHVVWSKPGVIDFTINVVPTTTDDINLATLHEANRSAAGKKIARDVLTMVVTYPDGSVTTFGEGIIVSGIPALGTAQSGRFKTRPYKFRFTQLSRVNAVAGA